ncbi:hypothetical protein MLD38_007196 [Melastoma candidum]|uniref:Uncharacterized protein n=1 Tax=Melastoma candidum TaxID=119954 RepID=A0ACB9RS91_9MYRT|nr:hypothetical protein MLD38_007196 [Melastoma candidum]
MAAKFNFFLTLSVQLLVLLYTNQPCLVASTSDHLPFIEHAQEKLDAMTESMEKSGYGLAARILQANLQRFIHEWGFMRGNITIFAPRDEVWGIKNESDFRVVQIPWNLAMMDPLPSHILTWRVEEEDFWSNRIVKDAFFFPACDPRFNVDVTEHPRNDHGITSINKARVLHWNIYRDDFVVVHGVDNLFKFTFTAAKEVQT